MRSTPRRTRRTPDPRARRPPRTAAARRRATPPAARAQRIPGGRAAARSRSGAPRSGSSRSCPQRSSGRAPAGWRARRGGSGGSRRRTRRRRPRSRQAPNRTAPGRSRPVFRSHGDQHMRILGTTKATGEARPTMSGRAGRLAEDDAAVPRLRGELRLEARRTQALEHALAPRQVHAAGQVAVRGGQGVVRAVLEPDRRVAWLTTGLVVGRLEQGIKTRTQAPLARARTSRATRPLPCGTATSAGGVLDGVLLELRDRRALGRKPVERLGEHLRGALVVAAGHRDAELARRLSVQLCRPPGPGTAAFPDPTELC